MTKFNSSNLSSQTFAKGVKKRSYYTINKKYAYFLLIFFETQVKWAKSIAPFLSAYCYVYKILYRIAWTIKALLMSFDWSNFGNFPGTKSLLQLTFNLSNLSSKTFTIGMKKRRYCYLHVFLIALEPLVKRMQYISLLHNAHYFLSKNFTELPQNY